MSKHVLFVDDEPSILGIYEMLQPLLGDDFSVATAGDGASALRLIDAQPPSVIVSDLTMPQMNGIAATREIIAEFPEANICMVTAFDDEEIREEALAAGAAGFVVKDNLFELEAVLLKESNP